jgi:predicted Zn-dependent protease
MKPIHLALACLLALPLAMAADPRVEFAFGVLAEARGNKVEAGARFEAARLADPAAGPLVLRAVRARMEANERPAAIKLYRDLAAMRQDDLAVQLGYADFLDQQGQGDSLALTLSSDTLDAALVRFPSHPEILRRLFQHAQSTGNKARQLALLEEFRQDDPASALTYASLSRGMFEAEDVAARKAMDERLLHAFEGSPQRPDLARVASDHFNDTGRTDTAIDILKRHAEAAPSSLGLRTRLGILLFAAKRDAEGEAVLKDVLVINPNQALAHQSLAKFYRLRGQPELACFHAGELLKLRGGSPNDFSRLADEFLAVGNPHDARLLLERAVFDHPDSRGLAEKLAIATRRDPETRDQAARLFREAETAKPSSEKPDPTFLVESAEALIDQGETKSAEERLRTAIRAYPADAKKDTAAALRRLAALWEKENRNIDAARALRQRADALDR